VFKWTKPDTLQFKWKNSHSRAYLWWQNIHYFSVFQIESAQYVMLFLWIGSKNGRVFLFGSNYRSAGSDTVRISDEFVTLAALSWHSGRRALLC